MAGVRPLQQILILSGGIIDRRRGILHISLQLRRAEIPFASEVKYAVGAVDAGKLARKNRPRGNFADTGNTYEARLEFRTLTGACRSVVAWHDIRLSERGRTGIARIPELYAPLIPRTPDLAVEPPLVKRAVRQDLRGLSSDFDLIADIFSRHRSHDILRERGKMWDADRESARCLGDTGRIHIDPIRGIGLLILE